MHQRNITNVGGDAIDGVNGCVVQITDLLRTAIQSHAVLDVPDFLGAGRQNQILRADRRDHIAGCQPMRQKRLRIEIHLDLTLLAAVRIGCCCTTH